MSLVKMIQVVTSKVTLIKLLHQRVNKCNDRGIKMTTEHSYHTFKPTLAENLELALKPYLCSALNLN